MEPNASPTTPLVGKSVESNMLALPDYELPEECKNDGVLMVSCSNDRNNPSLSELQEWNFQRAKQRKSDPETYTGVNLSPKS